MGQPGGSSNLFIFQRERDKGRERERAFLLSVCCRLYCCRAPSDIFTLHLSFTAIDPHEESVEDLMQRFQDSFRAPDTPTEISHYEHVMHSSLTGRRRVPAHTRGEPQPHRRSGEDEYALCELTCTGFLPCYAHVL